MSPNPQLVLDIPIGNGDSPWSDPYAGAIPEITDEDVDAAFPTEMVELPVPEYQQIANALLGRPAVLRSTHDVALWIRQEWQR